MISGPRSLYERIQTQALLPEMKLCRILKAKAVLFHLFLSLGVHECFSDPPGKTEVFVQSPLTLQCFEQSLPAAPHCGSKGVHWGQQSSLVLSDVSGAGTNEWGMVTVSVTFLLL